MMAHRGQLGPLKFAHQMVKFSVCPLLLLPAMMRGGLYDVY